MSKRLSAVELRLRGAKAGKVRARKASLDTSAVPGLPPMPVGMPRHSRRAWAKYSRKYADRLLRSDGDLLLNLCNASRAARNGGKAQRKADRKRLDTLLSVLDSRAPISTPSATQSASLALSATADSTPAVSLEDFIARVALERESFPSRMVPGQTVAREIDDAAFDWRAGHPLTVAKEYADAVVQSGIVAGELAVRACARFLKDLATGAERGLFLDPVAVENICAWFTNFCGIALLPWQVFVVGNIFGWKLPSGLRRFRECWLEVAKKNGKTALMASLALFLMVADTEPNAEVFAAANSKDQAKICFRAATRIWNGSGELHDKVKKFANAFNAGNSMFTVVSSETNAADGPNVHAILFDEVHEFADDELVVKYTAGIVARKQPLIFSSTTAGDRLESYGGQRHEYFVRLLTGIFENDSQFAFVASLDKHDDFKDERIWQKANVSLGQTVQVENLRAQILEIEQDPTLQTKFERYHCNRWLATRASHTFSIGKIENCGGPCPEKNSLELREWFLQTYGAERVFGGLDLGLVDDLTAFVALYPGIRWPEQELGTPSYVVIVPYFFMPEERIADREKSWHVPVRQWCRDGFIKPLPGDIIDMPLLKEDLRKILSTGRYIDVGFDSWQTSVIASELNDAKVAKFTRVPQQEAMTTAPCKELKLAVLSGRFCYLRNPVLKWMLQNVVLEENDRGGIIAKKLSKVEKIDGISATVNAWQRLLDPENKAHLGGFKIQWV